MNIYSIFTYIFIYLITYNKWNLVESSSGDDSEGSTGSPFTTTSGPTVPEETSSGQQTTVVAETSSGQVGTSMTVSEGSVAAAEGSLSTTTQSDSSVVVTTESSNSEVGSDTGYDASKMEGAKNFTNELKEKVTKLLENIDKINLDKVTYTDIHDLLNSDLSDIVSKFKKLEGIVCEDDSSYYSGFPTGWHFVDPVFIKENKKKELSTKTCLFKDQLKSLTDEFNNYERYLAFLRDKYIEIEKVHNDFYLVLINLDSASTGFNLTSNDIKFYTVDDNDSSKHIELDSSTFYFEEDFDYKYFKFKDLVECTLVKCEDKVVWKKGDYSIVFPSSISFNVKLRRIVLKNDDFLVIFNRNFYNSWVFVNKVNRVKLSQLGLIEFKSTGLGNYVRRGYNDDDDLFSTTASQIYSHSHTSSLSSSPIFSEDTTSSSSEDSSSS